MLCVANLKRLLWSSKSEGKASTLLSPQQIIKIWSNKNPSHVPHFDDHRSTCLCKSSTLFLIWKMVLHFLMKKWKLREICWAQFCHFCDIDSDGGHNCPYCSLHENGADKCATCGHISQMSHQNWLLTNSSKAHTISETCSPIILTMAATVEDALVSPQHEIPTGCATFGQKVFANCQTK